MKKKLHEWLSVRLAKNPSGVVLLTILLFNILFLFVSAIVIRNLSLSGTEKMGIFEAAFYTITMVLDAGCISFVISDIGESGMLIAIICLLIIIVGMVSFTGAVIGYVTNYISGFIEKSNDGTRRLHVSKHIVILNWNTRASEIVNDLLYCKGRQMVVILVRDRKREIETEISERLTDTINRENRLLYEKCRSYNLIRRLFAYQAGKIKNNVCVIIREGDVFSSKQLHDISLEYARSVIILSSDCDNPDPEEKERAEKEMEGNALTIKTLMQVSDITSAEYSNDNQKIIVEVSDDWTYALVDRIIRYKQVDGKCNIIPVRVNQILGRLLSQFSLMPELNLAYRELFSNKGATFFVKESSTDNELGYISSYLSNHKMAIPLTQMRSKQKSYFFYSAERAEDIDRVSVESRSDYSVKIKKRFLMGRKNVIILGHNSRSREIMQGFMAFRNEWNYEMDGGELLKIVVIDDEDSLDKLNYYKDYPFVCSTVSASIFDKELITDTIEQFVDSNMEDTSVLILSDDSVGSENIDANALANLVYVQDIINRKKEMNPDFDDESIDVIVELTDPKHHDIVSNYSVNNVVISNRYISKMITQIGEKEAIFDFYSDILSYDSADSDGYESKEIYAKKVEDYFEEVPQECTESDFVKAVWNASIDPRIPAHQQSPAIVLGYVKKGGGIKLFGADQGVSRVKLQANDKIIVFTNH